MWSPICDVIDINTPRKKDSNMKNEIQEEFICPICGGDLRVGKAVKQGFHIVEGVLTSVHYEKETFMVCLDDDCTLNTDNESLTSEEVYGHGGLAVPIYRLEFEYEVNREEYNKGGIYVWQEPREWIENMQVIGRKD